MATALAARSGTMLRRNGGLLRPITLEPTEIDMKPGDPAYSPTDGVSQNPVPYGQQPIGTHIKRGPEQSPGWWGGPSRVNPSQYIDQNVGGRAGDTSRLSWAKGLVPFAYFRQPFTGAALVPPRPPTLVVGHVGRLAYRDALASRVRALSANYTPTAEQAANAAINPQVGW